MLQTCSILAVKRLILCKSLGQINVMQTYGKIAYFKDFYKISNNLEKSQILYDDYLDHEHC